MSLTNFCLLNNLSCQFYCAVPENIHTPPTEEIGISWGVGASGRPKNLKKCMKLNWNFQRGGEVLEKTPSMGKVWTFSGTTHSTVIIKLSQSPEMLEVELQGELMLRQP